MNSVLRRHTTSSGVAAGTLVTTSRGDVPVENLTDDDTVLTLDNGFRPIAGTSSEDRSADTGNALILIRANVLGNKRDLRVHSNQLILVSGWQPEILFGEHQVMASAGSLINHRSIISLEGDQTGVFQIQFQTQDIFCSDGIFLQSAITENASYPVLSCDAVASRTSLRPFRDEQQSDVVAHWVNTPLKRHEGRVLSEYLNQSYRGSS